MVEFGQVFIIPLLISRKLELDPQKDQQQHLHLYKQLLNSREEEEEEKEEDKEQTEPKQTGFQIQFHGFNQNRHQLQLHHHQNQETIPPPNNQPFPFPGGIAGKKRPYLPSFNPTGVQEYAPEKMEDSYPYHNQQMQHNQQQQQQPSGSSRLGLRTSGGEIVEVQGGHIVRSTGRKDRHSKVCTAKGPRDRRVRLSAHTAIQFYDVQDRLGYDRPSKAVDWLIKKAKSAIDELAELPAWKPTATVTRTANPSSRIGNFEQNEEQLTQFEHNPDDNIVGNQMGSDQNSSFLPPSLDQDSIADTIKSFFPMGASTTPANNNNNNNNSSSVVQVQFHQGFPPPELVSRAAGNQSQDLRLSLQSFQDPILQNPNHHQQVSNNGIYFDGSGWPENQPGGFQRMGAWGGEAAAGGFMYGSQPSFLQPLFGQPTNNQLFLNNNSQRGPLQSSTTPSFRAWIDPPPPFSGGGMDQHPTLAFHHPGSVVPGFGSGLGGFSGFRVPTRIQGDPEEHDGGISDRPSSASSDSHH